MAIRFDYSSNAGVVGIESYRGADRSPKTPLGQAAKMSDVKACKALLHYGAQIEPSYARNSSVLFFAVENMHIELMALFLDKGADIEARNQTYRDKPLQYVWRVCCDAKNIRYDIITLFLERGADPNAGDGCSRSSFLRTSLYQTWYIDSVGKEECKKLAALIDKYTK